MYLLPFGIITLLAVLLDVVTKHLVINHMELYQSIPLIENVFHITYTENDRGPFSMFIGGRWVAVGLTVVILIVIAVYLFRTKEKNKLFLLAVSFITAGGIGNLIDRIATGKVTDFFDFCLINFAIFNVADCFVVCGVILLLLYVLISEKKSHENH